MAAPCYSERVDRALELVAGAFRTHVRKGSNVPYLSHLLAVAALVAEHGGDEDQIIAALLHDYLEDVDGSAAPEIEARFGSRVVRLVLALSDSTTKPKPPWEERKQRYVAGLRAEPAELKLISAADKLHNALSMIRDHRAIGDALWERFTPSPQETVWYYRSVVSALAEGWSHPLLEELRRAVDELEALAPHTK
jgi:(p)ppGpp synthase/HD superfamily hydrolase